METKPLDLNKPVLKFTKSDWKAVRARLKTPPDWNNPDDLKLADKIVLPLQLGLASLVANSAMALLYVANHNPEVALATAFANIVGHVAIGYSYTKHRLKAKKESLNRSIFPLITGAIPWAAVGITAVIKSLQ